MSLGMFLSGNAYSVLLKSPLIVLLFFLLKVLHCSGVFGSNFFCDPVEGQRLADKMAAYFFALEEIVMNLSLVFCSV